MISRASHSEFEVEVNLESSGTSLHLKAHKPSDMPLCSSCMSIDLDVLYSGQDQQHLPDARTLNGSAETCELCRLIVSAFVSAYYQDSVTINQLPDDLPMSPIVLRRKPVEPFDVFVDDTELAAQDAPDSLAQLANMLPMREIEFEIAVSSFHSMPGEHETLGMSIWGLPGR